jgi:CRISPR/Cas system-associated exonuclease Cas4 (RecB family)
MLKILQITKTQDFFKFNEVSSNTESGELPIIVTPNPQIADLVRNRFDTQGIAVESLTISKFIKNELNHLADEDQLENYKGKSELSLLLGAIWKKIGRGDDYISFKKAFNLLTELRSYSMNFEVFEAVLENYDDELAQGVLWLHRFLDEMGIIDEHKSYFLLSERLRAGDLPVGYVTGRNISFYGFDFMTASQVDLIKSFALRENIFIPIYKTAYEKAQNFDWIKWFDEHNLESLDIASPRNENKNIPIKYFPKGYFSKVLASIAKDNTQKRYNYFLGTKDLTRENIQEIPENKTRFKVSVDLFGDELEEAFLRLEHEIGDEAPSASIREFIQSQMKSCIEDGSFRLLKCYLVLLNKINEWESLGSDNSTLKEFDMKIIKDSAVLDLPRVNLTSLDSEVHTSIKSFKNLDEAKDDKILLGINSSHQGIKGIGANYTENVEKYLSAIGPIRRAEFEVNIFKERLFEFFDDNDVMLVVEEGLLEHDTHWSRFFSGVLLSPEETNIDYSGYNNKIEIETQKYNLINISASKLQKYIECPRKFYLGYADKLNPELSFDDELNVMELGQLEHKVIEDYFQRENIYIEDTHNKLINDLLAKQIGEKYVDAQVVEEYFIEIKAYTFNVIQKLFEIQEKLDLKAKFELPFNMKGRGIEFRGSIDCYLENKNLKMILDFKRSNFTFPSFTSILAFDQVQLWFYLSRLFQLENISPDDQIVFGYIDLSDISNSMLFCNDEDLVPILKKEMGFSKVKLVKDFEEHMEEYTKFENKYIDELSVEEDFPARPHSEQSCGYCAVKNICSRGL